MISNKKRKLNRPIYGEQRISAVAARKLQTVDLSSKSLVQKEIPIDPQSDDHFRSGGLMPALSITTSSRQRGLGSPNFGDDTETNDGNTSDDPYYVEDYGFNGVITTSRAKEDTDKSKTQVHLTTLGLNGDSIEKLDNGVTIVRLAPDERLVVLGEFGISVVKGKISILGATLSASGSVYPVFSLLSHSLPVIQSMASESDRAEFQLHHRSSGLRLLRNLSPLFTGIWPGGGGMRELKQECPEVQLRDWNSVESSYEILYSNDNVPRKITPHPIVCHPPWSEALTSIASGGWEQGNPAALMICGPKSSGKSTFAKLLINQLLTSSMSTFEQVTTVPRELRTPGVAFLDVDPGQPEYAPPGQVSLVYITEPNFGPPYSHPNASNAGRECIRAHSIASSSSASNTALYLACVTDLLFHYCLLKSKKKCPLVINTPGWVLGTGLELLAEIIQKASLTGVIYMSQEGPYDVVQSLRHVAGSIPFMTLPSQPTDFTARTAAHQRSMQVMSYLHFRLEREAKESWNPNPLVSMPPLMLKYTGNNAGIFGLMCQGEQPLAEMIIDRINGTLVAVVVIDDMEFIPGLTGNVVDLDSDDHSQGFRFSDWKTSHKWTSESEFAIDDKIERKIIIRTPELIPYFNPKFPISLDPRHSHTIGLALIRGVDVKRRRFHLLTPIPLSSLENITSLGKRIVLVSGNLDTPGWAYTEQLCQRTGIRKGREYQAARLSDKDAEDGGDTTTSQNQGSIEADLECAPWVDKVRGDQSRGVGAKAWRVRRDLGKNNSDKDQAS